ncbi:hypothetical protein [Curtobacterium sp. BRB10]|uniref:hypothetical protein n=1 Tax=Curtobacterium sp. BRB10 TaxID=2962579 RepID=UPI0028811329|nr:hypothetical protein [Curtobacterium sp. BRB10]MDT0234861.1 hypothetical protein [Curtobacterium sp. BRB10]
MSDPLPLVTIERGPLRAVFAPTRGGRLISLRAGDEELLWRNPALVDEHLRPVLPVEQWPRGEGGMGTWANVGGSKTWPAPQGWSGPDEWAGPPDPVLDAGAWDVVDSTAAFIRMRSAHDPRTGLVIERAFALVGNGLEERITMTNKGDRTTHWSPWEVCQVRTDDGGTVVLDGATAADEVDLGTWEGTVSSTSTATGTALSVGTGVAKRGYRNGRTVAYHRKSGTVIALSAIEESGAKGPFPDGGAMFEVWLQRPVASSLVDLEGLRPDAHLVELEVLGRRVALAPGDQRTTTIRWSVILADQTPLAPGLMRPSGQPEDESRER